MTNTFLDESTIATLTLLVGMAAIIVSTLPTILTGVKALVESKTNNNFSLTESICFIAFVQIEKLRQQLGAFQGMKPVFCHQ